MTDEKDAEVRIADSTGTIKETMTRREIEGEIGKMVAAEVASVAAELEPEKKAQLESALKKTQRFIALVNMLLAQIAADAAATTVAHFEATYHLSEYLDYQAKWNKAAQEKLRRIP